MKKALLFGSGLVVGVVGTATILYLGFSDNPRLSGAGRELAQRIESLPVEAVCKALSSGRQPSGEDHISVWTDKRRYVVGGWTVDGRGTPVFYWTGAALPDDVPECTSVLH